MNRLVEVLEDSTPSLVVSVVSDINEARVNDIKDIADAFELRQDKLKLNSQQHESLIRRLAKLPILGTIRLKSEGGDYDGDIQTRVEMFRRLMPSLDAVDVELSAADAEGIINLAKDSSRAVVVSTHNFDTTPPESELERIYRRSIDKGADFVKIATRVESEQDYRRLQGFTLAAPCAKLITVSMGEYLPENVAEDLLALGSIATFVNDNVSSATPWQLDYRTAAVRRDKIQSHMA